MLVFPRAPRDDLFGSARGTRLASRGLSPICTGLDAKHNFPEICLFLSRSKSKQQFFSFSGNFSGFVLARSGETQWLKFRPISLRIIIRRKYTERMSASRSTLLGLVWATFCKLRSHLVGWHDSDGPRSQQSDLNKDGTELRLRSLNNLIDERLSRAWLTESLGSPAPRKVNYFHRDKRRDSIKKECIILGSLRTSCLCLGSCGL